MSRSPFDSTKKAEKKDGSAVSVSLVSTSLNKIVSGPQGPQGEKGDIGPAGGLLGDNTLNDLRAVVGQPGDTRALKGHSTVADGGGGLWAWDNTTATDNGGTIANAGGLGSSSAGWRRLFSGPIYPEWFGAKGDGSTDDTAAIQLACAAIQAAGTGAVEFTGDYKIFVSSHTTPLGTFTNCTNIKLICRGGSLIIPDIEWAPLGMWGCFSFVQSHDIVVDGFTCRGGLLNQVANAGSGVVLVDLLNGNGSSNISMPSNRLSGAWTGLRGNQAYTDAESLHCHGINIGYLEVSGGTYGVNGRYSLDDMNIGLLKTTGVYRSLFMVGCKNVRAYVDSGDYAGSHDVIFAAQETWSVENCHVHYVHKRDTNAGISDATVAVVWQLTDLNNGSNKMGIRKCSTILDVKLADSPIATPSVVCQVIKATAGLAEDTTDRGYELHDFSISGRVDMNNRGAQAVVLNPVDNWGSGENAANIDLSNIEVLNVKSGTRPVWFNIARSLKGTLKCHNSSVPDGYHIELFGRSGAGPFYPPSDGLVSVTAVKADNRFDGSTVFALFHGAGVERTGGWLGVTFYKDATQLGSMQRAAGDFIALGATAPAQGSGVYGTAYILMDRDGGLCAWNSARNGTRNLITYDGGNTLFVGDQATDIAVDFRFGTTWALRYRTNNPTIKLDSTGLSFFNVPTAGQQVGGVATAGGTFTSNEQSMLQKAYDCLRTFGLLT